MTRQRSTFSLTSTQKTKRSIPHEREGLNLLYKLSGIAFLLYMQRFRSTKTVRLSGVVKDAIEKFEGKLNQLSKIPNCLDIDALKSCGLIKRKHYVYGAYLATISSHPILYWTEETTASILAKTSAITSIKAFDNLNDHWQDKDRALASLLTYLEAFTKDFFCLHEGEELISRAENSIYAMARWTHHALADVDPSSLTFKLYVEDFARLINGQINSLKQRADTRGDGEISIYRYLKEINEKGVGCIWLDIDFCFYERALAHLDSSEEEAINQIRRAMDYTFKACNLYDDVADLRNDLQSGIVNSVALLASDLGYCSIEELGEGREPMNKLMGSGALRDSICLADLIFLKGMKHLYKARCSNHIDVDALIFATQLLRTFSMRKWVLEEKSLFSFKTALRSFQELDSYAIPDHIRRYENYI